MSFCGLDAGDVNDVYVPLEVVFPSSEVSVSARSFQQKTIPPNVFIVKAEKPLPFFNKDWRISVRYKYQKLETSMGENVVWPDSLDEDHSLNQYVESPYYVDHNHMDTSFTIARTGTLTTRGQRPPPIRSY